MNQNSNPLIGPAGRLADLFARTLDASESSTVKMLFTGEPGVGKTELANRVALALVGADGARWAVESVNGRNLSIHTVRAWQADLASSSLFGTGWKVKIVNEVDTCPADAQDALLSFLDEMPPCRAFLATSNLDVHNLTPRFVTRLQRHEVAAPDSEEIVGLLVADGLPAAVANQIAFLCGGCVRAALLDAAAWRNENTVKAPKVRGVQTSSLSFA